MAETSAASSRTSKRLTVNLRPGDVERLTRIAETEHLQPSEVIRRALATEAFVVRTLESGRKILIEEADGQLREVEFIR
ncbi:MAG: hypothetical protein V3V29_04035 [Acidimicrobiia bacterium]